MSTKCDILFENNFEKVYYGGQLLSGQAIVTLTKEKSVRGIYVNIYGAAESRWCEHARDNRMTYRGHEVYLSSKTYLIGREEGDPIEIPQGIHAYGFSCDLPVNLPSSMEGTYGSIRYKVIITFDISNWSEKVFEAGFTVLKTCNLNDFPELKSPLDLERSHGFNYMGCIWCIQSKPLMVTVHMQARGFTPGEKIEVILDVNNQSSQDVAYFSIGLFKIITYASNQNVIKNKSEIVCLTSFQTNGIKKNQAEQLTVLLLVPPGPPTDLSSSTICKVRYDIEVKTYISYFRNYPKIRIPITVGTYPLIENPPPKNQFSIANQSYSTPSAPLSGLGTDIDPPTYEQVTVQGHENNEIKLSHFPLYPVFGQRV
ncbi:hypothetical protein HA402_006915 [Bradysia odoriphaga]|nr:hypothetical protein HA402_006915 [Bradysia odoriphaga]